MEHRTKTEAALAEAERHHSDDPARAELIARARRFKASWLELGEALTNVKRSGQWKGWGYDSFEAYAKMELRLKEDTVAKLTGSFQFLQRRAPAVLARDGVNEPIPSYQSIDFLRRAEEQEGAPGEAVSEIRRRVLDEGAPLATIAKQYRDTVFPIDHADKKKKDATALKSVATRLRELLGETRAVPRSVASEVKASLDALLAALATDEERAA